MLVSQSCLTLLRLHGYACQAPLSTGFSRQEDWSGLPFSSPGDLPDPGSSLRLLHCRQILYHLSHLVGGHLNTIAFNENTSGIN